MTRTISFDFELGENNRIKLMNKYRKDVRKGDCKYSVINYLVKNYLTYVFQCQISFYHDFAIRTQLCFSFPFQSGFGLVCI